MAIIRKLLYATKALSGDSKLAVWWEAGRVLKPSEAWMPKRASMDGFTACFSTLPASHQLSLWPTAPSWASELVR